MAASATKFVELSMPPDLAVEVARQMNAGVGDARRLQELGMPSPLAPHLRTMINSGSYNATKLMELGMVGDLAAVVAASGGGGVADFGALSLPNALLDGAATNKTSQVVTYYGRQEAEAPFSWVRIWILNSLSSGYAGVKASIAPTSTCENDTVAHRYYPHVAGVQDDTKWVDATFSGSSGGNLPTGTGGVVNGTQLLRPGYLRSDKITMASLARSDGGIRPATLVRAYYPTAAEYSTNSTSKALGARQNMFTEFYRVLDQATTNASATTATADGIADKTLVAMDGTNAAYQYNSGQNIAWVGIEYGFTVPSINILALGNSITCGVNSWLWGQDAWLHRGALGASDPVQPVNFINAGYNGRNSSEWVPTYGEITAGPLGYKPTHVMLCFFDNNDDQNAGIPGCDARHTNIMTNIVTPGLAAGVKFLVWSPVPRDDAGAQYETNRLYSDAYGKAFVSANPTVATLVDFRSVTSNSSVNPEDYNAGFTADNIHPSYLAGTAMAPLLKSAVSTPHAPRVVSPTGVYGAFRNGGRIYVIPAAVTAKPDVSGRTYRVLRNGTSVATPSAVGGIVYYDIVSGDYGTTLVIEETITNSQGSVVSTTAGNSVSGTATINQVIYADLSTATVTGFTTAAGADTNPLNGAASTAITETAGAAVRSIAFPSITAQAIGAKWFLGALVKYNATRADVQLSFGGARPSSYARFDIRNGYIINQNLVDSARILPVRINGTLWFWIEIAVTTTAAVAPDPQISTTNGGYRASYTGNTSNSIQIAQVVIENNISGGWQYNGTAL